MDIAKLKRRLIRLNEQKDELEKEHKGRTQEFTYHGGFALGYLRGKIAVLEDFIDDLEEMKT